MGIKAVVVAAILLGALLAGTPSRAETAGDLLNSCEAILKNMQTRSDGAVMFPRSGDHCWFYMSAIQDGTVLVTNNKRVLDVCAPPDSSLLQYVRIFVHYGRTNPSTLHQQAFATATYALREAFPCGEKPH